MGRRLQVNECLICGETPCACKAVKSRNPAPVKLKNPAPVKAKPLASPTRAAPVQRKLTKDLSPEDEDLQRALRVLAASGLMGASDIKKYSSILSGIPVEDRAAAWRARREASHGKAKRSETSVRSENDK